MYFNRALSNYASVTANNNMKLRLRDTFSYICCILSHETSTSGYCSRELKRNSKAVYSFTLKTHNRSFEIAVYIRLTSDGSSSIGQFMSRTQILGQPR